MINDDNWWFDNKAMMIYRYWWDNFLHSGVCQFDDIQWSYDNDNHDNDNDNDDNTQVCVNMMI